MCRINGYKYTWKKYVSKLVEGRFEIWSFALILNLSSSSNVVIASRNIIYLKNAFPVQVLFSPCLVSYPFIFQLYSNISVSLMLKTNNVPLLHVRLIRSFFFSFSFPFFLSFFLCKISYLLGKGVATPIEMP